MNDNFSYLTLQQHGFNWMVRASHAPLLQVNLMDTIAKPSSHPECRIIRENNVRASMLVDIPGLGEPLFVKHYKCRSMSDRFKYFFARSKVSAEWNTIHAMLERGIRVPRPLAKAERRVFGCLMDSYLFTEALVNARPLREFLTTLPGRVGFQENLRIRRALIEEVAVIISKIHGEGFFYRDLHAGNILVTTGENESPQIYPIDFHKVWHFNRLPLLMRVRDLAQLKNSLKLSQTDQLRFLKSYARHCPAVRDGLKESIKKINKKAARLRRVHIKSRTKRCLVESSEFSVKNGPALTLYVRKVYSEDAIMEILRTYDANIPASQATVLKKTKKSMVSSFPVSAYEGFSSGRLLIKDSRFGALGARLFHTLTKSRAKRAWVAARGLQVRGIKTPVALALIEMREFGLITRTILINEFIENAYELNDFVLTFYKEKNSRAAPCSKETFIALLARMVKQLHECGIYHADLKSNNILVSLDVNNEPHFYLVDLDRVHFKERLSFGQMANNLAQINASISDCITPADRLRFFRIYAEGTTRLFNRKRYFRRIVEIGRRKNTRPYGVTFSAPVKPPETIHFP